MRTNKLLYGMSLFMKAIQYYITAITLLALIASLVAVLNPDAHEYWASVKGSNIVNEPDETFLLLEKEGLVLMVQSIFK